MIAQSNRLPLRSRKPGLLLQRLVVGPDHLRRPRLRAPSQFSPSVLPLTVSAFCADLAGPHQLADHRGHAAGAMVFLAQVLAGRLQVHQQRNVVADLLPVVVVELHADVAGDRVEVDRRVGRAADRRVDDDGVLERFARHDLRGAQVFPHHLDDALAGLVGDLPRARCAAPEWRRSRAATCPAPRPASSWSRPCPWCCSGRPTAPRRRRAR